VKVPARLSTLFVRALSQSMSVDLMQKVVRTVIPDYDVHERSELPSYIPMTRADAARHILKDITGEGYFLKLIEALIEVTSHGDMGREVRIPSLPRIVSEVEDQGYRYSREKGVFIEAGAGARTMGWGTLREGRSYEFALLRLDIAGSSELVRRYPKALIGAVYGTLHDLVARIVEKRDGRIWNWEGDGGLAAFYFMDKTIQATLCGMEIVHELLLQNLLSAALPEPLRVRLAVHAGPCRFFASAKDSAGETIRRVEMLESVYTAPGSLTVSPGVFTDLGSKLSPLFVAAPGPDNGSIYRYSLEWEKK
jgi:class 3 adenylate cyclase